MLHPRNYKFKIHFKLIVIFIIHCAIAQDSDNETIKNCREKIQLLIGSDKTEQYELLQFEMNETVILECHYCGENDDNKPKNWYLSNAKNLTARELSIDMHKNESLNRISVSVDHELTIHRVIKDDFGTYFCRSLQDSETENFLNYIVEISFNKTKNILKGNMNDWKEYHNDYVVPINKKLLTSNDEALMLVRNNLRTNLEVITHWETKYRPCEVCGRPQGEGIQEKYGYCRIKIENNITDISNQINLPQKQIDRLKYLINLPQISCNSQFLKDIFPEISELTFNLSDFLLIRKCDGVCNPDAAGINRGWKFGSSKNYKYRRTMVLNEGEHLALVCPESNLDNKISWRRNGKLIEQSGTDENDLDKIHIVIDAFNSLYLLHVTPEEAGNYTCQVDKIQMQQIIIYVKSHSRLLTEAFLRHMMYLAIVLILTCSCYIAGCVVVCTRRHKFKGYEEVFNIS